MKDILLVVAGLTPQIITETLYCLTQVRKPPADIREIYVLTTKPGREKILKSLLDREDGNFYKFCREFVLNADAIEFNEKNILVFSDERGRPLDDIRTEGENEAVADQVMSFMREKSQDPKTRLLCSAAGGRKTMSLYLGYALEFFGRPQDELFHVLISPPELESHPNFYYPTKTTTLYKTRDGKTIPSESARVELARIPYLNLRQHVEALITEEAANYTDLVKKVQRELDLASAMKEIAINFRERALLIGGRAVSRMTAKLLAIYALFASEKLESCQQNERKTCSGCTACFIKPKAARNLSKVRSFYQKMLPLKEISTENIRPDISRINSLIRSSLQDSETENFYLILPGPKLYGGTRYGLRADRSKIRILD